MNTDEITREPLECWERSEKTLFYKKRTIWACAMRLMEAGDPDAIAHITAVGHKIDLDQYEIDSAKRNAAKRTGWTEPAAENSAPDQNRSPDVTKVGESRDSVRDDLPVADEPPEPDPNPDAPCRCMGAKGWHALTCPHNTIYNHRPYVPWTNTGCPSSWDEP
jgi:hypothetical protein